MASFGGIIASGILIRTFGLGCYMLANALVFGATALACAVAPTLAQLIGPRAIQGLAAGAFGPVAFVAVFTTMGGPRLPFGLTLLAFTPVGRHAAFDDVE